MLSSLLSAGPSEAGAWPEPERSIRGAVGYSIVDTDQQFAPGDAGGLLGPLCPTAAHAGDRMPFSCATGGRYTQHALQAELGVAPLKFLSFDLAVPIVLLARFIDDRGATEVGGIGDLRFGLHVGHERGGWAISGALAVTAPTGPPGLQDREVPLGEGHWEVEPSIHGGRSLWPWGWVEASTGLRVRLPGAEVNIDRGDEWIASVSGGFTPVRFLALTGRLDGLLAAPDVDGFGLSSPGRAMLAFSPGLAVFPVPDLTVGVDVILPLAGQRWPAGVGFAARVGGRIRLPLPTHPRSPP